MFDEIPQIYCFGGPNYSLRPAVALLWCKGTPLPVQDKSTIHVCRSHRGVATFPSVDSSVARIGDSLTIVCSPKKNNSEVSPL